MKVLSFLIIISVASVIAFSTYNSLVLITGEQAVVMSQKPKTNFEVTSTGTLSKLAIYANRIGSSEN